jgi:two-component system, LuxR family, sensor kinase FixL
MKLSEEYLVGIEESSKPMWVVETKSAEVIAVNKAALDYFGCSRKQFSPVILRQIFSPEFKGNLQNCLGKKSKRMGRGEIWRFKGNDGKWLSGEITLNPARAREGNVKLMTWHEQNEGRMRGLLDVTDDGIVEVGREGDIISWNRGAERIYGFTAEEALGRPISVLLMRKRNEADEIWKRVLAGERVELVQNRLEISLLVAIVPLRDAAGNVNGAGVLVQDLTERRGLELDVLKASEWEQQRIAQDLHDGLGQHLAGVHCRLTVLRRALEQKNSPEAIEAAEITELLNQAVGQARALARGLYPVRPDPAGFMSALKNLALWVEDVFKIQCEFRCKRPVLIGDNAVVTHLYRIAQEAITNSYRHGRAKRVKIELLQIRDRIKLTVEDDGLGIPPAQNLQEGLGLRLMHYRAEVIQAKLEIQRSALGGARIVCSLAAPK